MQYRCLPNSLYHRLSKSTLAFHMALDKKQLPDASLLRRVAAWIYDLFLLFAVSFAYGAMANIIALSMGAEPTNMSVVPDGENMTLVASDGDFQPFLQGPLFQLGLLIVLMSFYVLFWIKRGATLGMQTWRMEIVDLDGRRPNIPTCVFRCAVAIASFTCFGLGYFWSLWDGQNRTAHDIFTKTRVVVHPKKK